jgi:hypothetical protein
MRLPSPVTRVTLVFAAIIAAGAFAMLFPATPARADISVHIDFGNAPPPPRFVFMRAPRERRYAGEDFYVVDDPRMGDDDVFRAQGFYWVFRSGYWYRAPSWRGPFRACDPRFVPAAFYRQPPARWKHHPSGPPRYRDTGQREPNVYRQPDGRRRDHGRGRGNGNGNGNGRDKGDDKHDEQGKGGH